jgi:hypothetical protein
MRTKHPREWAAPLAALFILVGGVFVATVYVGSIHGPNAGDLRIPVLSGAMRWLGEKIPGGPQADAAVVDEGRRARMPAASPMVTGVPASAAPGHSGVTGAAGGPAGPVTATRDVSGEPPPLSFPVLPTLPALGVPVPTSVRVSLPTVPSVPRTTIAPPVGETSAPYYYAAYSSATVYRYGVADAADYAGSSAISRGESSAPASSAVRRDESADDNGSKDGQSIIVASGSHSGNDEEPVRSSVSGSRDRGRAVTTQAVRHAAPKSNVATSESSVGRASPGGGNKSTSVRVASKPKASVSRAGSRVRVSPSRSVPAAPQSHSRVRSGRGTTHQPMKAPSPSRHESRASSRSGGGHR